MAKATRTGILIAATLLQAAAVLYGFPATMTLERAFPTNHRVQLSQLRARDSIRHGRILQSADGAFVDFPVAGTFNPYLVGLYFTTLKLGSPPKEFYVQIDTGSDVLWVTCDSCNGCPKSSGLKIELNSFDLGSSTTASLVSCSDQICSLGLQSEDSACSSQSNFDQCIYSFQYGDGSGTSGYYVQDLLYMDTISADYDNPGNNNSSASIVFGCSTSATGDLTSRSRAVDGIFGFGQQEMSVISQLSSQGIAPNVFSHCFRGDNTGGGILVLGEIVEPNIVYTPLVPSQPHYNLNLLNISVNGKVLPINSAEFTTSTNTGTIIDSGTTLAYLAQNAYDPFVNAITNAVSQQVTPVTSQGNQCYIVTSSITVSIFPQVIFNFAGNASMVLGPKDYLLEQNSINGGELWCIGFQKNQGQDTTILGDLVLKDRIVVYDLAGQRIGWADYDCSMSVNVSANTSTGTQFANMGPRTISSSFQKKPLMVMMIPISMVTLLVYMSTINIFF
ncbi:aspartic proteinase 36-like [Humulus lupulus]|uniref:aspartic proteinase 36-like n=1 Tax=Humulus lupulus TaxID=3486 RepID=UPI002B409215|nr:aspartic proteinase 36-like [Humulus lupulus]